MRANHLDTTSIKPASKKTYLKSSSPIPSMLQRKYSTANCIHSNLTPWPFLANCIISLTKIMKIPLNFGNVLVTLNRDFTRMLIKIPSYLIPSPLTLAKYLGIIVRNLIVTTLSTNGK